MNHSKRRKITLLQIFYHEESRNKLDAGFIPLDNTHNSRPDWYEYWPIRNYLLENTFSDDDLLGFFSAKFGEKTDLDSSDVFNVLQASVSDIYSFTSKFSQNVKFVNPFHQGERHQKGLLAASRETAKYLRLDVDVDNVVSDSTTTIFSNFFVAKFSFWKQWFYYVDHIFRLCESGKGGLARTLCAQTTYKGTNTPQMKIFVMERLVAMLLEHLGQEATLGLNLGKLSEFNTPYLQKLMHCDALKGQYRTTRNQAYLDEYFRVVKEV